MKRMSAKSERLENKQIDGKVDSLTLWTAMEINCRAKRVTTIWFPNWN